MKKRRSLMKQTAPHVTYFRYPEDYPFPAMIIADFSIDFMGNSNIVLGPAQAPRHSFTHAMKFVVLSPVRSAFVWPRPQTAAKSTLSTPS